MPVLNRWSGFLKKKRKAHCKLQAINSAHFLFFNKKPMLMAAKMNTYKSQFMGIRELLPALSLM